MTVYPSDITGELVVARRRALGLSRDRFAELIGVKSGALWRFENRDVFKLGEREHLAAVADRWLGENAREALQNLLETSKSTDSTVAAATNLRTVDETSTTDFTDVDDDVIQWADALRPDLRQHIDVVYPADYVSPTTLTREDGLRRVSNSEVSTFKRCRRKWWLTYVRGLRSRTSEPFGARATGTRGHLALAAWYRPDGEPRLDPRDAIEVVIATERARLKSSPNISEESLARFNKDAELERVVITGYVEWLAETGADAEYRVTGSERYLEARLTEVENTRIIARLDARVVRRSDNARMFLDHKFVASITGAVRLLPMSEQMMWYLLLEELQPDRDPTQRVGGALYNMLRRCKRSEKAIPPFYQRTEVHHGPIEIASFRKRLVGTLDDMQYCRDELAVAEQPHQLIVYPTPTRDCPWDCPFIKVCTMADDGSRFEDALADHYVVGDPYSYYESSTDKTEE